MGTYLGQAYDLDREAENKYIFDLGLFPIHPPTRISTISITSRLANITLLHMSLPTSILQVFPPLLQSRRWRSVGRVYIRTGLLISCCAAGSQCRSARMGSQSDNAIVMRYDGEIELSGLMTCVTGSCDGRWIWIVKVYFIKGH